MKRFRSILCFVLALCFVLMMPLDAFAAETTITGDGITNIRGIFKNTMTIFSSADPITFDLEAEISTPTTTYSPTLARLSAGIALCMYANDRYNAYPNLVTAMGLNAPTYYDPTSATINAATGYYVSNTTVQRNGKPCKLILVSFNERTHGDFATVLSDMLLTGEKTQGLSEAEAAKVKEALYASDDMCSITDAGAYHLSAMQSLKPAEGDYLFWFCGSYRGGSVANDLAHRLIDLYGTEHVMCYSMGSMNVSRAALGSEDTSKYNSIFRIANSDDACAQLPLGDYAGWGYKSWGVDVVLGFPSSTNATSTEFYTKLNTAYKRYLTEYDMVASPSTEYPVYDNANGVDLSSLLQSASDMLDSQGIKGYYEKELTIRNGWGIKKTVDSLYAYLKQYIEMSNNDTLDSQIPSLLTELAQSYSKECDVQPLLKFGMAHALRETNALALAAEALKEGFKVKLYESVVPFLAESYLAWATVQEAEFKALSAGTVPGKEQGLLSSLPEYDSSTKSSLSSNNVTVSGEKMFYSDLAFAATATANGYDLTFGYASGTSCKEAGKITACNPYGVVTLSVPAPANICTDCVVTYNGQELPMTYDNGTLSAQVSTLNGSLEFPITMAKSSGKLTVSISPDSADIKSIKHVLAVVYDSNLQLAYSVIKDVDCSKATTVEFDHLGDSSHSVKLFFLNDQFAPKYTTLTA